MMPAICPKGREYEWFSRVAHQLSKGLSPRAAEIVVDAAMFGIGCTEGRVREEQQKRIDAGEVL